MQERILIFLQVRLGIIGNEQNNCFTPDSFLGFGSLWDWKPYCGSSVTVAVLPVCGNVVRCKKYVNTDQVINTMGYILIH